MLRGVRRVHGCQARIPMPLVAVGLTALERTEPGLLRLSSKRAGAVPACVLNVTHRPISVLGPSPSGVAATLAVSGVPVQRRDVGTTLAASVHPQILAADGGFLCYDAEALARRRGRRTSLPLLGDLILADLPAEPEHRHRRQAKPVLHLADLRQECCRHFVRALLLNQQPAVAGNDSCPTKCLPRNGLRCSPEL